MKSGQRRGAATNFQYRRKPEFHNSIAVKKLDGGKHVHVEAAGVIVNVYGGQKCPLGRPMVVVQIVADGDRYVGRDQWWIEGMPGEGRNTTRVMLTEKA